MNEKLAISKFEQNIRDQTIKVLVSAGGKSTLDDCITFAMQKELIEKNKNIKNCTWCGIPNHTEETCFKKKNSGNQNRKKNNNNGNGNGQNRNSDKNTQNSDRSPRSEQKPSTSGNHSGNFKNRPNNFNRSKNDNGKHEKPNENQKSVKIVSEEEKNDLKKVKDVLKESDEPKN